MQVAFNHLRSLVARVSGRLAVGAIALGVASLGVLPMATAMAEPDSRLSVAPPVPLSLPDGVYLYGQATKPEQIGSGYFVFEVTKGEVVGALYMPRSSFDCASGRFHDNKLALQVVNSYDRSTNPFQIALERDYSVASEGNPAQVQIVGLEGFHRLDTISENDQRMLNVCKQDLLK